MEKIITKIDIYPDGIQNKSNNLDYPYFFIQNTIESNYRISASFEFLNKTIGLKINIIRDLSKVQDEDTLVEILNNKDLCTIQRIDNTEESQRYNKEVLNNIIMVERFQFQKEVIFVIGKSYTKGEEDSIMNRTLVYFGYEYSSLDKFLKYGYLVRQKKGV